MHSTPLPRPPFPRAGPRTAALLLAGVLTAACGGGGGGGGDPKLVPYPIAVDASAVAGALRPLWRDHYDLSYTHMSYAAEPGFTALVDELAPRSWRCSVGRWEIGFPPPAGGDSLDLPTLGMVEREFYRGPNTPAGADDPLNYDFTYLDAQLVDLTARGAVPFLCFDYMPLTLSAETDPLNGNNLNLILPGVPFSQYSFSNGIRTAPPQDPAVYARVVRNTVRHVRGLFAGTTDYGVDCFEIGNEPDLIDAGGQVLPFFWTGTPAEWFAMYAAVAAEIDADPLLSGSIELGAASFAFGVDEPAPLFSETVLSDIALNGTRLDFLSFHSYNDDPAVHFLSFTKMQSIVATHGITAPWSNAEWGRALDGLDPVYDQIEHGLFRARVLILMQLFPFTRAHQALFRDPAPGQSILGLVKTGPPAHKPVSHVYQALGMFDTALDALPVTAAPTGSYVLAARNPAADRVLVAVVMEPAKKTIERVDLAVTGLPWGAANYRLDRWRVTEESSQSGPGVELVESLTLSGDLDSSVEVGAGRAGLYLWELTRL